MSEPLPLLSVVTPAYNEEAVLPFFHRELMRLFDSLRGEFRAEVVYVDDGSRDATPDVLEQFARLDSRARFVRLSRNFGQQAAITAGLEHARGDAVVTMDCDLQHPPEVIRQLIESWKGGADVVLALRQEYRSEGFVKRKASHLFHWTMHWCSGMELRSNVSEFRLLSRKALDALLAMPERLRYLRGMVNWIGFPSAEVSFEVPPRAAGRTKFTLVRMVRLARDGLLSFSRVPLHAALLVSVGMIAFSFLCCLTAWMIWRPQSSGGWLALSLVIGTHFGATGIWIALVAFSEYLARIHEQVLGRPIYVVRDSSDSTLAHRPALPMPGRKADLNAA